jgi:thiamine biosynthesis protein ThiS
MKVTVNGKEREFEDSTTLSEMLKRLNLDVTGMIIEKNLEVMSRSEYDSAILKDGDKVELIRLVAGG